MSRKENDTGRWTDATRRAVFARVVLRMVAANHTKPKSRWEGYPQVRPKVSIAQACRELAASGYSQVRPVLKGNRIKVHLWATHPDKESPVTAYAKLPAYVPRKAKAKRPPSTKIILHEKATVEHGNPAEQFEDACKAVMRRLRPGVKETGPEAKARKQFRARCIASLETAITASALIEKDLRAKYPTAQVRATQFARVMAGAPTMIDWAVDWAINRRATKASS